MKFEELTKEKFSKFLENHPLCTFFQSIEMEEIGKLENWTSYYVGITENQNIVGATRIMGSNSKYGKRIFYAPRGILVDYHNEKLLKFFITHLKKFVKSHGGYTLHIDPPLIYVERDINGDVVPSGIDNKKVVNTLKKLGFHHDGFIRHYDPTKQVRWSFELPLKDKTKEQILKEMNGNTRRAIQKAIHLKVTVRDLKKEELSIFKEIMEETGERRNFIDKTLKYYETMYDIFKPKNEIKYMVAEVNLEDTKKVLMEDRKNLEKDLEKANKKQKGERIREIQSQIENLQDKENEIQKIEEEKGNHLYLACGMFMIYGRDILYYHAGSYKEYMNFFGQYLIQWTMIEEAISLNKDCYNFYGIKGVFEKSDPDYGVYLFKRGFNGKVIEYIGDFYLPVTPYYYFQKLKSTIKKKVMK